MSEKLELTAPAIAPVPEGVRRPLWSVMIPTFNCANHLRQTLESVLAQDPGPEQMQIEVVDDVSTKDDPEAVIREVGQGRVAFFRKSQNGGATANFNTCIERSRGHLVHILHGDDYVFPGFYAKIEGLARAHPDKALIGTRVFHINETGIILSVGERVVEFENGSKTAEPFYYQNPLQCAGIVMRRSFYEQHGGFLSGLAHTADCEMWARAVHHAGGVVTPEVLAAYRVFEANDTGRLRRTADNLRDTEKLHRLLAARHENYDLARSRFELADRAEDQTDFFMARNDLEAARANREYWKKVAPAKLQFKRMAQKYLR
jgi:glycosyltransferase involved in cell wall biosynthesis